MNLKVLCVSLLTLLVALAVNPANASPNHDQILELKIGKFTLSCKGDCSSLHRFRDKGILRFGTKEKMISNKDKNERIYTYNIINDFPHEGIPYYCTDGAPQIKIGTLIYKNQPAKNTFKFFNRSPNVIGIYTSSWGATGWGSSTIHLFDTVTGEYFREVSEPCGYPSFQRDGSGAVVFYTKSSLDNYLGPPNFSPVYLKLPHDVRDLKGKFLKDQLIRYYEFKIFDKAFEKGFFSERELNVLEEITQNWDVSEFDQGQKELLKRFVILVGYDIVIEGYDPLREYFNRNTFSSNELKELAFKVIKDLPEFGNDLSMSFHKRYE
jgi:hypothetical protein